jgi:Trk-type K+ transport system membrane component
MVTILMIAFLVIFMTMFPEFKEKAMEEAKKKMSSKDVSQEQVEKALEITKKYFMVFLIGGALLGYLLFGAIASLIGAAVTKKDPRPFEDINQIGQ